MVGIGRKMDILIGKIIAIFLIAFAIVMIAWPLVAQAVLDTMKWIIVIILIVTAVWLLLRRE